MVEVEFEVDYNKKLSIAKCPSKTKTIYTVSPAPGGFIFYHITTNSGPVAYELSGRYTSLDKANEAIRYYVTNMKKSIGARRDAVHARIDKQKAERHAAENDAKDSDDLREGSDN